MLKAEVMFLSASMQPEFNRTMHTQIGPRYTTSGIDDFMDPALARSQVDGARMKGNYYSSRPAAIFHDENERQENAVRPLSAPDNNANINSAYALRKTSFTESKEANAP